MSQLMDLQERVEDRNAEREFNAAMSQFQAIVPTLVHDAQADTGKYKYTFATLAGIVKTIRPALEQCGLTYTWDSEVSDTSVKVTCTVRHCAGHSKSATFTAPIDKGARMNVMQQGASALSYARRYALQLALGLVTADTDDDARGAGPVEPHVAAVTGEDLKRLFGDLRGLGIEGEAIGRWIEERIGLAPSLAKNAANWQPEDMVACRRLVETMKSRQAAQVSKAAAFESRISTASSSEELESLFQAIDQSVAAGELSPEEESDLLHKANKRLEAISQ